MNKFWLGGSLVMALLALGFQDGKAETPAQSPAWFDTTPLGKPNLVFALDGNASVRVDVLGERLFRVRYSKTGQWTESALNRYGVLPRNLPEVAFERKEADGVYSITTSQAKITIQRKDGAIAFASADGKTLTEQAGPAYEPKGGYDLRFSLGKDERLYGLGDVSRENIMRRGEAYEVWIRNVKAYIPIPMLLSHRGWGLLMNTTWRNTFDVGKSDPDRLICTAPRSDLDYYLFCGPDYRSLLDTYTAFTGRPSLLPIWGYGLTYVCNENIDVFNMINEALTFRREGMPCDVIGLEPGWMAKYYDLSTEKKWNPQRFPIPEWGPTGDHTFQAALGRKGFKLSLWLCCDYDLGVFEEQQLAGKPAAVETKPKSAAKPDDGAAFEDPHLTDKKDAKDANAKDAKSKDSANPEAPKPLEPWFEHLKKFVDQGASCFKLDGCAQVLEHADRQWGNGMTDEEMHNLYPVIYAKQMACGFEEHAKRRSMVYSAGGYTGVQQYVATWAGDTGGGAKPLASMLNLGFSGHSNHSCDMDDSSVEGLHFGFLQTWAQQNNWGYWRQPWLLNDTETAAFREYGRLRYKLIPYLYSTAAQASMTGYPAMRAMSLVYPDDPAWDACRSQYMLGDFLLVSAFTKEVRLPDGVWFDYWSGKPSQGPATLPVQITPKQGGALLVKRGAIIPTWPECNHLKNGWSPEVGLLVYPAERSEFSLYEDDGTSLGYHKGEFAQTRLTCETAQKTVKLTIGGREGKYAGMPDARNFTATVHLANRPQTVTLDGVPVTDFEWNATDSTAIVKIPACGNKPRECVMQMP